ncbi:Monoamine oxidase, partial [uncultured Rubrobacteraceae bacterium]
GRPLRRPAPWTVAQERLRRGRVQRRGPGQLARARLRLPRRDPLLRRRHGQRRGRPRGDQERRLPARGGCRPWVEALRHE